MLLNKASTTSGVGRAFEPECGREYMTAPCFTHLQHTLQHAQKVSAQYTYRHTVQPVAA